MANTPACKNETGAIDRVNKPETAVGAVVVKLTADHADWLYKINEKVLFNISVSLDESLQGQKNPKAVKRLTEYTY